MFYDKVEIEAIKIAVGNLECLRISSREALMQSIVWLREHYETNKEEKYLTKAIWHIYAYLELGFPYEAGEEEFDKIAHYIGNKREDLFPFRKYGYKRVKLSKCGIRSLLGNWNPVLHSMKINDVVNDIWEKVQNREAGTYLYHSGKVLVENEEKQLWRDTYKLYINEDEAIFHDLNRNKYYMFVGKENDKKSADE